MRIVEILGGAEPCLSFEFFPPKTIAGEKNLFNAISQIKELRPGFVSVTCGAGGTTRGRTVSWVEKIKRSHGIEAVAHLTCLGIEKAELAESVAEIRASGIENVLALRGDPPINGEAPTGGCRYASELIEIVREHMPEACIAAACYPETHTEAASVQADLDNMKRKADAGVDFFITQLFFDNAKYFEFLGRARSKGITQPIVPGIMPIQNVAQVKRFIGMCGASIPEHLLKLLDQYQGTDAAVFHIGVAHAIAQSHELLQSGAPGVHFYTLNKSPATRLVVEALRAEG